MAFYSGKQKGAVYKRLAIMLLLLCLLIAGVWQALKASGVTAWAEEIVQKTFGKTVVVGFGTGEGSFHPLMADGDQGRLIVEMTQAMLTDCDRDGKAVLKGIEGETRVFGEEEYTYYGLSDVEISSLSDGRVRYDFALRQDVLFADGEALDADDVIFTMYALCDTSYNGSFAFGNLPVRGLEAYHFAGGTIWQRIVYDGREKSALGAEEETYSYSAEDARLFWELFDSAGTEFAQEIVDYCAAEGYCNEGDVAAAADMWGYGGLAEDASAQDFFQSILARRGYDLTDAGISQERPGNSEYTFMERVQEKTAENLPGLCGMAESAENIAGIQKLDQHTVRVELTEERADALEAMRFPVIPMHYYGDPERFDPEKNRFGFTKGNFAAAADEHYEDSMGAGPYRFEEEAGSYEFRFRANPDYYLGAPKVYSLTLLCNVYEDPAAKSFLDGDVDILYLGNYNDPLAVIEHIRKELNGGNCDIVDGRWFFNWDSIREDSLIPDRTDDYDWVKGIRTLKN